MKRVVIGMSGGVDSSVSAYLLKKSGYDVIAVYMQNWDPYLNNENIKQDVDSVCDAEQEFMVAKEIADYLEIPIYKTNFIKEYWVNVFEPFLDEYKKGNTPNPDVLCNKYIKFGAFHEYCFENFNVDFIATGHYARKHFNEKNNIFELQEAKDDFKDQTYFLCSLNQKQLSKSLFPIGHLTKEEVRNIAKGAGLLNWNKKDSTGICFIGERNFKEFMNSYIDNNKGKIIDILTGDILGEHNGIHLYTIGQRKGLNLSGLHSKYFVCKKDAENNVVYVTDTIHENKYLFSKKAWLKDFNWISYIPTNNIVEMRFRHTQKKIKGKFLIGENKEVILFYDEKSKSVTNGQYAVLYQDGICLGGGIIFKVL